MVASTRASMKSDPLEKSAIFQACVRPFGSAHMFERARRQNIPCQRKSTQHEAPNIEPQKAIEGA